jgi:hypothetical protein
VRSSQTSSRPRQALPADSCHPACNSCYPSWLLHVRLVQVHEAQQAALQAAAEAAVRASNEAAAGGLAGNDSASTLQLIAMKLRAGQLGEAHLTPTTQPGPGSPSQPFYTTGASGSSSGATLSTPASTPGTVSQEGSAGSSLPSPLAVTPTQQQLLDAPPFVFDPAKLPRLYVVGTVLFAVHCKWE